MLFGCQQESETGVVGQQFVLKADIPEEVGTFDYIWKITDLPESSELMLSDIQFSEDESQAIFIPDVAGHFTIRVTVWKYNDKLGALAYDYDITKPSTEEIAKQQSQDDWLNETVDETTTVEEVIAEVYQDKAALSDAEEAELGTSPTSTDTDADGLFDREEVQVYKTDPLNPDTDGDGYQDGAEVKQGYNPSGDGKLFELPEDQKVAVGTEFNLVNRLRSKNTYVLSSTKPECPTMNETTLKDVYLTLKSIDDGEPLNEIKVDAETQKWANIALERMLAL